MLIFTILKEACMAIIILTRNDGENWKVTGLWTLLRIGKKIFKVLKDK
jgi:hypothetical protein